MLSKQTKWVKNVSFIFLSLVTHLLTGQNNFELINGKQLEKLSDTILDYKVIVNTLTNDIKNDEAKAREIYLWITHNIKYDVSQLNGNYRFFSKDSLIKSTIQKKIGVCENYSQLFHVMASEVGVTSYLIKGYTKPLRGSVYPSRHSWNAVYIDSNFYLVDATWGAGYILEGKFIPKYRNDLFMVDPKMFIRTHMPFDPIWQFSNNPVSNLDFIQGNLSEFDRNGSFAFKDSIIQYTKYNALKKLETSTRRIINNGIENPIIKSQVDENNYQICFEKYRLIVEKLNQRIDNFNSYLKAKNSRFNHPKMPDDEIIKLITLIISDVTKVKNEIEVLDTEKGKLDKKIRKTSERIYALMDKLEEERLFVERYISTWKLFRWTLWLQ